MYSMSLRAVALPLLLSLVACGSESDDPNPADSNANSSSTGSAVSTGTAPADETTDEPADETTDEPADETANGSADSSTGDDEPLVPIDLDRAWIERMEGQWNGPVQTPYINIPEFPLDFAWQPDGSLYSFITDGEETSFAFTFADDGERWTFTERGELPGGMIQSYTLHPVAIDGDLVRWVYLDEPERLVVDLEVTEEQFRMNVTVRGVQHASFAHTPQ
ncbi:MAG: hypothetical protein AAGF11_08090 [Myxococcota bacterium]